jgi:hypothetical protein
MKSGFWQIQIHPKDHYKTAFTVPFGQYEWNIMPFGFKNAPSELQRIMNDIFNAYENKSTRRKTAGNSLPNKTKTIILR